MNVNEAIKVRVSELDQLSVQHYRAFKHAVLVDTKGEVLAYVESQKDESTTYLQYRLLTAALQHQHHTSTGPATYGIAAGDVLTVCVNGQLNDYVLNRPDTANISIVGDDVRQDGETLVQKTLTPADLLEGNTP